MYNNYTYPCPSCHYKCYSPSPYWIINDYNQRVRVQLYHCINCGYEPQVKEAESMLEDPSRRDKRFS